ncbi:hypothetical protein R1flu_014760 [Riccia fluitans]|uniref:DDE-1 domain-containing protein n=1 Tax=Riccia fluitans TaxID=41844 RepID=A0ABD1YI52_9MARC
MGIIAALNKRFKYLYLKDVLEFYQLDDEAKIHKKEEGQRLRWGVVGVAYGNPAHLLDAANYVNEAWQSVSCMSIKNAFIKADIMPLETDGEAENKNEEFVIEVVQALSTLNLSFVQDELEEFVHIDDENNEEFAAAVLEDVEQLLQTMKVSEENQEDVNEDENVTSQVTNLKLGNIFVFKGFELLYKQVVDREDQLICSEVQAEAEETFDDLRKSFELFQSKVCALNLKAKCKKFQNLRQMTIHDMMN